MSARGLNIFVNIGGKLLPSLTNSVKGAEAQFNSMARTMKVRAAEMKATWRSTMAAASPLLGLAAAGGLALTAKAAIGDSAGLAHDLQMLRNAGRTSREVAQSMAAANRTIAQAPTSTLRDNLKMLNETTLAYGDVQRAIENLSFNAKMGGLLKSQLGDEFGGPDTFNKLVRVIELRGGKTDSKTYQRLADHFYRAMAVSGGTVNADELLGFAQQANPGMRAYSEDYLSKVIPSMIQEFGGERAGTVSSAFTMQIMGKTRMGGKSIAANWEKLGLLRPGTAKGASNLSSTGWNPKDVVDYQLALSNPLAWFEKDMIPRLKKAGYNMNDPSQVLTAASLLFGRQTGARLASTYLDPKQLARIHADMGLYGKAPGVNQAYGQTLRNDPTMAWQAVKASTNNMLSTMFLGQSGAKVNAVAVALVHIANGINRVAGAFQKFPKLGQGVGALLLGSAGIAGLKVLGIGLRFIFSPLKGIFNLLFLAGGRKIGIVGYLLRGISFGLRGAGRLLLGAGRFLGPMLFRGLAMLAPMVMEGLGAAFALLSNPIGWAIILGAVVIGLAYYFRGPLMAAWKRGWTALKTWVFSINWRGIGMSIANALTFGLAGKFADAINRLKASAGGVGGTGIKLAPNQTRILAGARANGGPVLRGRTYLVGERGAELFTPFTSGRIIPHMNMRGMRESKNYIDHTNSLAKRSGWPLNERFMNAVRTSDDNSLNAAGWDVNGNLVGRGPGRTAPLVGELHIHGAHDPHAVALEVRRQLNSLANQQAAVLSD